jgi:hypothetical protein
MRSLVMALLGVIGSGCASYSVRRAALVPHMAPVGTTGQPMTEPLELSVGTADLLATGDPSDGGGNAGLYIPRVDLNGGLRARIGPLALGLVYDHGANDGATAVAPDMPHPDGDTYGGGVTIAYAAGSGPFHVGLELDLLRYSIPWKEMWTCVQDCQFGVAPTVQQGREGVGVYAVGVVPSVRTSWGAVYGGATLRNHPTIAKGDVEQIEIFAPVESGPVNLVLSFGVEVRLAGTLRGGLLAYVPLGDDPVRYPVTLAASLTAGIPAP